MGPTSKGRVTLFPTIVTLRNAGIHVGAPYCSDIPTTIEGVIDEHFGLGTILGIPYVDPDNGHVRLRGCFDYPWFGSERDVVEKADIRKIVHHRE